MIGSVEWGIPECLIEVRLDDPANRVARNLGTVIEPDKFLAIIGALPFYGHISWGVAEEKVCVTCRGNGVDCPGGSVNVDPVDLRTYRMCETTAALGAICTARYKNYREGPILRTYEDLDYAPQNEF